MKFKQIKVLGTEWNIDVIVSQNKKQLEEISKKRYGLVNDFLISLIWIVLGMNKANVIMSTVMRYPMNMVFGDYAGDQLLEIHKDMDI